MGASNSQAPPSSPCKLAKSQAETMPRKEPARTAVPRSREPNYPIKSFQMIAKDFNKIKKVIQARLNFPEVKSENQNKGNLPMKVKVISSKVQYKSQLDKAQQLIAQKQKEYRREDRPDLESMSLQNVFYQNAPQNKAGEVSSQGKDETKTKYVITKLIKAPQALVPVTEEKEDLMRVPRPMLTYKTSASCKALVPVVKPQSQALVATKTMKRFT